MKPVNRTLHTKNNKRGISPAVAAIILIVAAVVIGVLVVMYTMGLFKAATTTPQIVIKNVDLYCDSSGHYEVYVTLEVLKGSITTNKLKAYVYTGSSNVELTPSTTETVNPGETVTLTLTNSKATGCTVSNAYTVMIYYSGQRIYSSQLVAQSLGG